MPVQARRSLLIGIPPAYAEVVECLETEPMLAVVHPRLDVRSASVVFALACRDASERGMNVAVVGPSRGKLVFLALQWLGKAGLIRTRHTFDGCSCFELHDGGTVWAADFEGVASLPPGSLARLYLSDAHALDVEQSKLLSAQRLVYFGELADRDRWFYRWAYQTEGVRRVEVSLGQTLGSFPDQAARVLQRTDPMYPRAIELRDVEPSRSVTAFRVFARTRLKIRTDKPLSLLTPSQRAEASTQFGTPVVSFEVHSEQKRYLAMQRLAVSQGKAPWFVVLKSRRVGMTTLEQGKSYQYAVQRPRSYVATLAHVRDQTIRSFAIARMFSELDPRAPKLVGDSTEQLQFENGSLFFIGTAGGKSFARGDTLQRIHGTEFAYWCPGPNQVRDIDQLLVGIQNAARQGEIVLESTANGHNHFYQLWVESKSGTSGYVPIFIPWYVDPLNRLPEGTFNPQEIRETLSEEEKELVTKHGLDDSQIAFRRQEKMRNRALFPQEYPEDDVSCFISFGTCLFDAALVAQLLRAIPQPIEIRQVPGGILKIWERPQPNRRYVHGVDTSEGIKGGDPNGIGVLDATTRAQVASLHGWFTPPLLARWVGDLHRLYPGIVAVERESFGFAVLDRVQQAGIRLPHYLGGPLFCFDKDRPGWNTDSATRPEALTSLAEDMGMGVLKVRDEGMLNECLTFRLQSNGKFEADSGAHDDYVMKWAIANQVARTPVPRPGIHLVGGEKK